MQPAAGTMRLDPQLCKDLLLLFAMLNCLYGAKQSATEQFFKESVSLPTSCIMMSQDHSQFLVDHMVLFEGEG